MKMFVQTTNMKYFVNLLFPMKYLFTIVVLFNFAFAKAQNFWQPILQTPYENLESRNFVPENYLLYNLNLDGLKQSVAAAPMRFTSSHSSVIVSMPDANGDFRNFEIFETQMMEPQLSAKYQDIRTYIGLNVEDAAHVIRFSLTSHGFHNIEFAPGVLTVYIDPFTRDHEVYIVYDRSSIPEIKEDFECFTDEVALIGTDLKNINTVSESADDSVLRTYRVAISCNAEYGNLFAGTGTDAQKRANIQARQVITMNRVNGVYERDLAVNMIFVANNDLLLYFGDTSLDPYTNDFNNRTQDLIDGNLAGQGFPGIGNANYDIGHNFNTSGGGNAGCIGCVCVAGQKGSGMTGRANPTGDPFDIDYVAHEMGHQFGGYHSMASSSCRSGSGQTEVEPGSGSTIMAYAGICNPNIQNNSDDYFHYVNIRDITANIKTGPSSSCPVITNVSFTAPIANAGIDYVIPFSTAFVLTGTATNLGSETVVYNWEQNDPENPGSNNGPDPTRIQGPMYRSLPSVMVPERYFPALSDVVQGNLTPAYEVTPSVARSMEFAFTVRKYDMNVGQNDSDLMNVTVDGTSGPFTVTTQDSNISYNTGEAVVVGWDVAGTDQAPINTTSVDILLSVDGGLTFDTVMELSTPNDGTETVVMPVVVPTNQARIMVRANGNVYYAVNSSDFTVTSDEFSLSTTDLNQNVCLPANAIYDFTYRTFNGFSTPTVLTLTGAPAGSNVVISPNVVTNDNTPVNVTISGLNNSMVGSYNLILDGTAGTAMRSVELTLNVLESSLAAVTLVEPVDMTVDVALFPTLEWSAAAGSQEYDIEIALDSNFSTIIQAVTVSTNIITLSSSLNEDTLYYWRVRNRNVCGNGVYSSIRSFRTANIICVNESSTVVPLAISSGPPSSFDAIITVTDNIVINDISLNIDLSHTWMSDVDIYLTSPSGTQITIIEDRCNNRNDLLATFTDDGAAVQCTFSAPTISGTVNAVDMFSVFNGENALGDWVLTVADDTDQDGGSLNDWSLDICGTQTLSVLDDLENIITLYPNPSNEFIYLQLDRADYTNAGFDIYDTAGRFILSQSVNDVLTKVDLSHWASGMYLIKITIDDQVIIKQVIKE
ncbi:reprolysin-like metallopeptidase [Nonlabens arenilitoris]|nr:zinc-dependent metalloprotease family protein [Nonlabens arenilitoris]